MRIIKQTLKEYASFSQEMELNQHHKQHLLETKKASLKIVNQTPPWKTDFQQQIPVVIIVQGTQYTKTFSRCPYTDTSLVWQCLLTED